MGPYVCCETSEYQIGLEHACQDQRKGNIRVSGKAPVCEGIGTQWTSNMCFIPRGNRPLQHGKKTEAMADVCLKDWQTLRYNGVDLI